jgi:FkbM family methyltransferase
MTTAELLGESVDAARVRERGAFDDFTEGGRARIVLFGAGALGRKICAVLKRHGVTPLAFADNAAALQGSAIDGVPVLAPADAAARFAVDAVFVVTIFRGAGDAGMAARCAQLGALGCGRVTTFLPLAWKWAEELLPHYGAALPSVLLAKADELRALDTAWADAASRTTFQAQLAWRLRADFSGVGAPAPDQYFPRDLFTRRADERLVDGGAFDGDTLRVFGENFARAWAIEPDPKNAVRLTAAADARVTVLPCALGARRGKIRFADSGTVASAADAAGGVMVRVETLDALLPDALPTLIKLDIEGAELDALVGARAVVGRARPLLAVCAYHAPEHLWTIPREMRAMLPGHALALRAHQYDGFELVAYAVPPERRVFS